MATLAEAQAQLAAWEAASAALATSKSYTTQDGRTLTRANVAEVQSMMDYWRDQVRDLSAGRSGARVTTAAVG